MESPVVSTVAGCQHNALRTYTYIPSTSDINAVVFFVHGYAEHAGRYRPIAEALNARQIGFVTFDLSGHGESDGDIHALRASDLAKDVQLVYNATIQAYPDTPFFIMGHSLGGLLVWHLIQNLSVSELSNIRGVVLTAPALRIQIDSWIAKSKMAIGKILGHQWPTLSFKNEINPFILTHDRAKATLYKNDPFILKTMSAGFFLSFLEMQNTVCENHSRASLPTYVVIPGKDALIDPAATESYFGSLDGPVTVVPAPNDFHEVLNEPDYAQKLSALTQWMSALAHPKKESSK